MAVRFTSTDTLPSATRHACNRALHRAGLPTLGSARTIEAYVECNLEICGSSACTSCPRDLRALASALRPVGFVVPRSRGAHA